MLFWHDVVLIAHFPPYPSVVGEPSDTPLEKFWVVRPQQFFFCYLLPRSGRKPKRASYTYGTNNIQVQLVFYSTLAHPYSIWA